MSKIEVIHICDSLSLQGGYEKVICDLSNIFSSKGHSVKIVCLDNKKIPFYNVLKDVKIFYSFWTKSAILKLPFLIRLPLLYLNKTFNLFFLKFVLRNIESNVILIFHRHGFNDQLDFSRFFSLCSYDLLHMDYGNEYCNQVNPVNLFFRVIKKPKQNLIVLTEKSKLEAEKDGILNVCKINNPFIADIFSNKQDSMTFLNMGRYGYQKNQKMILHAFNMIHERIPNWNLKIVGQGVNLSVELNYLIDKYNLRDKIFLLDKTNEPIPFFRNASVFILSSRFEGLPLVLLEAIASGNLIISSKYEGHEEVLNNSNSLLFEIDDVSRLSVLMLNAAENIQLRYDLTQKAAVGLYKFSSDEIYNDWVKKIFSSQVFADFKN